MYSCQFSINFPLPKNGGHFEFSNFCQKCLKHKFASISFTVRDRAISSKFSTHRVSKECTLANFQKFFPSPKMVAILNFRNFFIVSPAQSGILWIHHRRRPHPLRFLVSDLQYTFLSRFLSYLAGGLIWWRTHHPIFLVGFMSKLGLW